MHPDDLGTPGNVANVRPAAAVTQENQEIHNIFGYQSQISADLYNPFFVWIEVQMRSILY